MKNKLIFKALNILLKAIEKQECTCSPCDETGDSYRGCLRKECRKVRKMMNQVNTRHSKE